MGQPEVNLRLSHFKLIFSIQTKSISQRLQVMRNKVIRSTMSSLIFHSIIKNLIHLKRILRKQWCSKIDNINQRGKELTAIIIIKLTNQNNNYKLPTRIHSDLIHRRMPLIKWSQIRVMSFRRPRYWPQRRMLQSFSLMLYLITQQLKTL